MSSELQEPRRRQCNDASNPITNERRFRRSAAAAGIATTQSQELSNNRSDHSFHQGQGRSRLPRRVENQCSGCHGLICSYDSRFSEIESASFSSQIHLTIPSFFPSIIRRFDIFGVDIRIRTGELASEVLQCGLFTMA